jgi:hypothetical protein
MAAGVDASGERLPHAGHVVRVERALAMVPNMSGADGHESGARLGTGRAMGDLDLASRHVKDRRRWNRQQD